MALDMAVTMTAEQAVAHRLVAHHLVERLPGGWAAEAVYPCPLADTAPVGAGLAMAARVEDLFPGELDRALLVDRDLLRLHSLRGAVHVVAHRDAAVFGPGALAADEWSLRDQLLGDWLVLEAVGWTAHDALKVVTGVLAAVLADGEDRTTGELSAALHEQVPVELEPWCDRCEAHHVPDQLLRLAGTAGSFCYGRPRDGEPTLLAPDAWLGGPLAGSVDSARVELARRFIHAYGPTTPEHMAAWAGIGVNDARERFGRLRMETVDVELDGKRTWVLEADLPAFAEPPTATGVRLLGPDDPFLLQRDRATLLPQADRRARVWEPVTRPGVVLVDGRPTGTWRSTVRDRTLAVEVEPFHGERLAVRAELAIEEEAALLAAFFGCGEAEVEIAG